MQSDALAVDSSAFDLPPAMEPGMNMIELHVGKFWLNREAVRLLRTGLDSAQGSDPCEAMQLFFTWDFYNFETQATAVLSGEVIDFNVTVQYPVEMNDVTLHFLHRAKCSLELHQRFGMNYRQIGACPIRLSALLDTERYAVQSKDCTLQKVKEQVVGLVSPNSDVSADLHGMILGEVEYTLKLQVPMEKAIRLYRDRCKAQAYLNQHLEGREPSRVPRGRTTQADPVPLGMHPVDPSLNELEIRVVRASGLRTNRAKEEPSVVPSAYFVYQFFDQPERVSSVVPNSSDPVFDDVCVVPLRMDLELDRYLRTTCLAVHVMDDSEPQVVQSCLGVAQVPLLSLARSQVTTAGEPVFTEFELVPLAGPSAAAANQSSKKSAVVEISLNWRYRYTSNGLVAPEPTNLPPEPMITTKKTSQEPTPATSSEAVSSASSSSLSPEKVSERQTRGETEEIATSSEASKKELTPIQEESTMQPTSLATVSEAPEYSEQFDEEAEEEEAPGPYPLPRSRTLKETADSKTPTPPDSVSVDQVRISIDSLVVKTLSGSPHIDLRQRQLFVEFECFGCDDLFETQSAPPAEEAGMRGYLRATFDYAKEFAVDFKEHYERRQYLAAMLTPSDPNEGRVRLVVVSEPKPNDSGECEEIGVAWLDVREVLRQQRDQLRTPLPVTSLKGSSDEIGKLTVSLECLPVLRVIVNEMPNVKLAI